MARFSGFRDSEKKCQVEDIYLCLCQSPDNPTKLKRVGISSGASFFTWDEAAEAAGKKLLGGWFHEEGRIALELV
jgi:hypothetical protein